MEGVAFIAGLVGVFAIYIFLIPVVYNLINKKDERLEWRLVITESLYCTITFVFMMSSLFIILYLFLRFSAS